MSMRTSVYGSWSRAAMLVFLGCGYATTAWAAAAGEPDPSQAQPAPNAQGAPEAAVAGPASAATSAPANSDTAGTAAPASTPEQEPATSVPSGHAQPPAKLDGFKVSPSDDFVLLMHGSVQVDGRYYPDDDKGLRTNTFMVRRLRPWIEGTAYKYVGFRLQPDFGGGKAVVEDAYLEVLPDPLFSLRFGKMRVPFSIERLQSSTSFVFVESSLASNLAPNRDVGLQLYGTALEKSLGYQLGVFNGSPDNASADLDNDDHRDWFGRLYFRPFRLTKLKTLFDVGVGFAYMFGVHRGTQKDPSLPTYRTPGQQTLFAFATDTAAGPIAFANGLTQRLAPQAGIFIGPLGVMAEYIRTSERVSLQADTRILDQEAYEVTAELVLTGERASYDGLVVAEPFDWSAGKTGAIELIARHDWVKLDRASFALRPTTTSFSGARAFWGGINWYPNNVLKLSANFVYSTLFASDVDVGAQQDERELTVLVQGQAAF